MSLLVQLRNQVKEILENKFSTKSCDFVPTHENKRIAKLNVGLEFTAATLYIDMRESTAILERHNKGTVGKIHKVYYEVIIPILLRLGGKIRSYNGDSLLAFFTGKRMNAIGNAIKASLQIKYAFSNSENGLNSIISKYSKIDFGIGIDFGNILCTKIGSEKYPYSSDLIWIGRPVNTAVKLGDQASFPESIRISNNVYLGLPDRLKYEYRDSFFWGKEKNNQWSKRKFKYYDTYKTCYSTSAEYVLS